jgi:hypothetical protein
MKIRTGFVSNSSASSFVILLADISDKQMDMIINNVEIAKKIDNDLLKKGLNQKYEWYDGWSIRKDDTSLWLHTTMDNFDMVQFIEDEVGIDPSKFLFKTDEYFYDLYSDQRYIDYIRRLKILKIQSLINEKNKNKGV